MPSSVQVRDLFDQPEKTARMAHAGRRMSGKAPDMQLIDDRILRRHPQRLVALPVVVVGQHDAANRVVRACAVATARRAVPTRGIDGTRPGVHQLDAFVEHPAVAARVPGALHAPGVTGARRQVQHQHMPAEKGVIQLRVEFDHLERPLAGPIGVQQQRRAGGVPAVDGEIDALVNDAGARRIASTGANGMRHESCWGLGCLRALNLCGCVKFHGDSEVAVGRAERQGPGANNARSC